MENALRLLFPHSFLLPCLISFICSSLFPYLLPLKVLLSAFLLSLPPPLPQSLSPRSLVTLQQRPRHFLVQHCNSEKKGRRRMRRRKSGKKNGSAVSH